MDTAAIPAPLRTPLSEPVQDCTAGSVVGKFRLSHRIGRGGMGEVWLAQRIDSVHPRPAAVKILRHAAHTDDRDLRDRLEQRFRAEAKILASLDHPNIARFIDAGVTEAGTLYVAMEYVSGSPINIYCQSSAGSLADRLALFRQVCGAVEYAHRNLVVHRDIKPGNILVTHEGVPKLLDFGIAKLLRPDLSAVTCPVTRASERLMTPEFASPEQIQCGSITTATDVYSLGVLLYALLTNRLPYPDDSELDIERMICQLDPIPPSRFAAVPADLESIVFKALQKEPDQRYAGADRLSDDIGRYLSGFPVKASGTSARYRATKFLRRHRVASALAAVLALVMIASAISLVWMSRRWRRERDQAHAVTDFLIGIIEAPNPEMVGPGPRTDRQILDQAAATVGDHFRGQPDVEAAITEKLGDVYRQLGIFDQAGALFERSVALFEKRRGPDSEDVARNLVRLADLLREKANYPRAEAVARRSLAIRRRASDSSLADVADSLNILGVIRQIRGDAAEAEAVFREAVDIRRRELPGDSLLALSLGNLGNVVREKGNLEEAESLFREALAIRSEVFGPESTRVASSLGQLSQVALARNNPDEALRLMEESLRINRKAYPNDHPDVARTLDHYGKALLAAGRVEEAETTFREALAMQKKSRGEDAPEATFVAIHLADLLADHDRAREARPLYQYAVDVRARKLGENHPLTKKARQYLAQAPAR